MNAMHDTRPSETKELINSVLDVCDDRLVNRIAEMYDAVIDDSSKDMWDRLLESSQKSMVTSLFSYSCLLEIGENNYDIVDFGGVISMMMRALEGEVKKRFCTDYIEYLKRHDRYEKIENYCRDNGFGDKKWKCADERKSIILKTHTGDFDERKHKVFEYKYRDSKNDQYTLGSVARSLATVKFPKDKSKEIYIERIDRSFMDYCMNELLDFNSFGLDTNCTTEETEKIIEDWIRDICIRIDMSTKTRNDASHGGKTLSHEKAKEVLNDLFFIKKIIIDIVSRCK